MESVQTISGPEGSDIGPQKRVEISLHPFLEIKSINQRNQQDHRMASRKCGCHRSGF